MKKFFISLRAKFLIWLMSTKLYRFFLRYILPNIKFLHAPGPNWDAKQKLRELMQPGDIMISKDTYALTNLIIGGKFSHGSVVTGKDTIAQMTANDFDVVDVNEFSEGCTRIALLRIKDLDGGYGEKVSLFAMTLSDRRYDVRFTLGVEALYCSELCYQSDYEHRMEADLTDLVGMGRPYISPDGLYDAHGLEIIYEWNDSGWK